MARRLGIDGRKALHDSEQAGVPGGLDRSHRPYSCHSTA